MKAHSGEYLGTYAGRVVATNDVSQIGRIKVRVPVLHGISGGDGGIIEDKDLPWAFPASLPAGGSKESGGVSWLPVLDDQVWIRFLDGELDKPIWEWANQTVSQSATFGKLRLHSYESDGLPVRRAAMTRYQHWWELLPTGHDVWTKSGYHATIEDELNPGSPSGRISWTTALGYLLAIDDSTETLTLFCSNIESTSKTLSIKATESIQSISPIMDLSFGTIRLGGSYNDFFIDGVDRTTRGLRVALNQLGLEIGGPLLLQCSGFSITTGAISFDSSTNNPSSDASTGLSVSGDEVELGNNASDPLVRLSDLVKALQSIKLAFDTHTHLNGGGTGLSGVPAAPAVFQASGSEKIVAETSSSVSSVVG